MNLDLSGDQCVWLPCDVRSDDEVERLIEDPNWVAQRKEDGVHVIAARTEKGLTTRNRRGTIHAVPANIAKILLEMPIGTMLDGEKMHEGGYVVFDIMYLSGNDLRAIPYEDRFELAVALCRTLPGSLVFPVMTAFGAEEKRKLVEAVRVGGGEGCIFKDIRASYRPGRPAEGGPMRRLKFRKSMTCIVQRRLADAKRSFEVYLYRNGEPINIGSVSAAQFYDQLQPGEARIAECTYLYATPNNRIVQPVLKRPAPWREDKTPEECTFDQLIKGGRFAGNGSAAR